MTKYTVFDLEVELSKFEESDWEAISTVDFIKYLKAKEAEEKQEKMTELGMVLTCEEEEVADRGSYADQEADYFGGQEL